MNDMGTPEKLSKDKYELDEGRPHIAIDNGICRSACETKPCLRVCAAEVYGLRNEDVVAEWAACLECGTCRVACTHGGLSWEYPRGRFGVVYRYG